MILKCNACGRSEDLSPLRIGRKHGACGFGGKWLEVEPLQSNEQTDKRPRRKKRNPK